MSKKLGKLVKEARTAKGLTQAALAEMVDGVSASDISKIERGEKEPSQAAIRQMAKALDVTQKSLLEAATGSSASSSGKTSGGKTSSTGKTSSAKTTVSVSSLTATEKKLVQLYRKADASTKKAAMNILSGEGSLVETLGPLLLGKNDVSSAAAGMLGSLLQGAGKKEGPVQDE